jgi:hypothetical protein
MWHQHSLRHTRKSTPHKKCRAGDGSTLTFFTPVTGGNMSSPKRFRFTNQLIKSLPPNTSDSRSTDAEYSDTEISGLKCLVSKEKDVKIFAPLPLSWTKTRHRYWSLA